MGQAGTKESWELQWPNFRKGRLHWTETKWPNRELENWPPKMRFQWVVFQLSCCVWLCVTHWLQHARPPCPSPSPEVFKVHVNCISDVIQLSHPLTPSSPSALNLSQHQGFFYESVVCIRWPKSWSFNFSISPSSEYSGLISLKIDWFEILAVQGTLKSLQHHSSKASLLQRSAFLFISKSGEGRPENEHF